LVNLAQGDDIVRQQPALISDAPLSAWYALAILILVTLIAFVDRQILVLIAEPLRKSFGLSDARLGMLQGVGLALFVGIAAFPIGWLADRYDRRRVMAGCILVWSSATIACGLAQNFWQLMIAIMLLGVGEAGLAPIVYGLIPELFRNRKRLLANSIFAVVSNLAAAAGFALAGSMIHWINAHHDHLPDLLRHFDAWRLSFFVVAIPGPLMVLLMTTIRTHRDAKKPDLTDLATDVVRLGDYLRARWWLLARFFIGCGFGSMGFATVTGWVPIIVSRFYGVSADKVGAGMGAALAIGMVSGFMAGSLYIKRVMPRLGGLAPLRVIWLGFLLAALPAMAMPWATSAPGLYALVGAQIAAAMVGIMSLPGVVQELAPGSLRSRVIAIGIIMVIGMQALGPVSVGVLSDQLKALPNGLTIAVTMIAAAGALAGGMLVRTTEAAFCRTLARAGSHP
jgi:MFS family permease